MLDSLNISNIIVPIGLLEAELSKAPHVPDGNPEILLGIKQIDLPSEFVTNLNNRIAEMQFMTNMSDAEMDTIRYQLFMSYREAYNDSVMNSWIDRLTFSYQSKCIAEQSDLRIEAYKKSVEERNNRITQRIKPNGKIVLNSVTGLVRSKQGVSKKMMIKLSCKAVMAILLLKTGIILLKPISGRKLQGDILIRKWRNQFRLLWRPDILQYR